MQRLVRGISHIPSPTFHLLISSPQTCERRPSGAPCRATHGDFSLVLDGSGGAWAYCAGRAEGVRRLIPRIRNSASYFLVPQFPSLLTDRSPLYPTARTITIVLQPSKPGNDGTTKPFDGNKRCRRMHLDRISSLGSHTAIGDGQTRPARVGDLRMLDGIHGSAWTYCSTWWSVADRVKPRRERQVMGCHKPGAWEQRQRGILGPIVTFSARRAGLLITQGCMTAR